MSLFPHQEKVFDTPKPEELIRQILEIATNEGDLVLDSYLGSGTTLAVAHKLKRNYIGIEIGEQMTELVVNRLKSVIMGEKGGISDISNWQGGGDFAYFIFDKTQEKKLTQVPVRLKKKVEYHQLDFSHCLKNTVMNLLLTIVWCTMILIGRNMVESRSRQLWWKKPRMYSFRW